MKLHFEPNLGYKALMAQNPDLYTVEVISTKVGKSPAYVPAG